MSDLIKPKSWLNRKIDAFQERARIPAERVKPLFAIALGYKDATGVWCARAGSGADGTSLGGSLYHNGILFVRVMLPFFFGIQIRWAGKNPHAKEFFQMHAGIEGDGRPGGAFRRQSDVSGAEGYTHVNVGQAVGWMDGPK